MLSLVASLMAQITSPAEPPSWGNLVLSIVSSIPVAAVLGWRLKLSDDKDRAKDERINDLENKVFVLVERTLPVLADATRALADAARHHDSDDGSDELRRQMRRLQSAVDDLGHDRKGG